MTSRHRLPHVLFIGLSVVSALALAGCKPGANQPVGLGSTRPKPVASSPAPAEPGSSAEATASTSPSASASASASATGSASASVAPTSSSTKPGTTSSAAPTTSKPAASSSSASVAPSTSRPAAPAAGLGPLASPGQLFPANDPWNTRIDNEPVDPNSSTLINSIGSGGHIHPDFGADWDGGPFGIPFNVVDGNQSKVSVSFEYDDESDRGPYPIPSNVLTEKGSDSHILLVDRDNKKLYELFYAHKSGNQWTAGSGAIWDLTKPIGGQRPAGWTSADAAGLPILPGLARYDEVAAGAINHALRFTVSRSRSAYVFPASHCAGAGNDSSLPPMGMRVRMKASYDISRLTGQAKVIATAFKQYGMILADNGSNWYVSGTPDARWSDDDLGQLKGIPGSAFEVVKMGTPNTRCFGD